MIIHAGIQARQLSGKAHSYYHVRQGIRETAIKVREIISRELAGDIKARKRFAISTVEWTEANRRFLNVDLKSDTKTYCLGKRINPTIIIGTIA